eukprot:CAMPEP_0206279926 /NCGR_PEP_ID=MMETSP0047_2-20121206/38278_1 /ASSEMBLY_ACC=CAM_ASM_000192 /TAXON_ID=195065 /ORGANISM="Chroomonas mesostigmatica_cf, Strain CCMP1168" /LENGTH=133 /DNA_ID=CAMNT_0053709899 /DNA_START=81 /DNA_END=479 /DNA_ORIENTATION=+
MAGIDSRLGSPASSFRPPVEDPRDSGEHQFESKAEVLHSGITHPDAHMRRLAAEQLPGLCERKPVQGYVIEKYLLLLEDTDWVVRRIAVNNLVQLAAFGDKAVVRALIMRTWSDDSSTIRHSAIKVLEQLGDP